MNETKIPEGDNLLTIFYRPNSLQDGGVPFEELKYKVFDPTMNWIKLNNQVEECGEKQNIFSLVHSPK